MLDLPSKKVKNLVTLEKSNSKNEEAHAVMKDDLTGGELPAGDFDKNDTRHLQNGTLCTISALSTNFNPRNIKYIPAVEIFAFLELEHKLPFFKGLDA